MSKSGWLLRRLTAGQIVAFAALCSVPLYQYLVTHNDATLAPDAKHAWKIEFAHGPRVFVTESQHFRYEMSWLALGVLLAIYFLLIYLDRRERRMANLQKT